MMSQPYLNSLIAFYFLMIPLAKAQIKEPDPQDSIKPPPPPRIFPYSPLREADLLFKTRHWERIDIREKINLPLYYPMVPIPDRKSLFDVLIDGILIEESITEVYADDKFEIPYTTQQVRAYTARIDTIFDEDDPSVIILIDTIRVRPRDVIAYELKSDWFFDKQRGEMKNRIIGISPVIKDPRTQDIYNLFWVWYPDARLALTTYKVFNQNNYVQRLNFDQLFRMRFFNSVIFKESNVSERAIADYKRNHPMEQLLEGQRIKEKLRDYEHDLWEY